MSILRAIGLMSGTSLDGVDIALIETDGEQVQAYGPTGYRPYKADEQDLLRRSLLVAATLKERNSRPDILADAEAMVTRAHAQAVEEFISANNLIKSGIAIVGFHGQTILHRPDDRLTVQIGDGKDLATRIGIPVAYDFRAADMATGGQGAPLVPVYHQALARKLKAKPPIAIINIGGVSNVTYLDGESDPLAFDTGPGNAPIDDLMRARTGKAMDSEGKLATRGKVAEQIVGTVLKNSFFERVPPKSLDRAAFAKFPVDQLSDEDAAATVTAIVAASIAKAFEHFPKKPSTIIVVGGGACNPALMAALQERIGVATTSAKDVGWQADAVEAQAFAYLAVRTLRNLPITFPTTTGVVKPSTGGVIARP